MPIPWGTLTPSKIPTYESTYVLLYPGFQTTLEKDPRSIKSRNTANEPFPFNFAFSNAWQHVSMSLRICFCHCLEPMFQILIILCSPLIPTYYFSNVSKMNTYFYFMFIKLQKGHLGIWYFLKGPSCQQIYSFHKEYFLNVGGELAILSLIWNFPRED